ncbi:MAG: GNAT family N-acetyltransferase [Polyangiales bacterium]
MRFARRQGEVVGCVGCERHGDDALLRSLAVSETARSLGAGTALVRSLLAALDAEGVRDVYLLTLDAARFFERFGFEPIDRAALPNAIAGSREGVMHACDDAVPMRRDRAASGR